MQVVEIGFELWKHPQHCIVDTITQILAVYDANTHRIEVLDAVCQIPDCRNRCRRLECIEEFGKSMRVE